MPVVVASVAAFDGHLYAALLTDAVASWKERVLSGTTMAAATTISKARAAPTGAAQRNTSAG